MSRNIYLIGSLRDPDIKWVAKRLRHEGGHSVFDDWHGCGPDADKEWQKHEQVNDVLYADALFQPLAEHSLDFDRHWLDWCDTGVLVGKGGTSAHIEACYLSLLQLKPVYWLMTSEPEKWDIMPRLWITDRQSIVHTVDQLLKVLEVEE